MILNSARENSGFDSAAAVEVDPLIVGEVYQILLQGELHVAVQ